MILGFEHFPDPPAAIDAAGKQLVPNYAKTGKAGWIFVTCAKKGCSRMLGHWSKTGELKPEYRGATCKDVDEKHKMERQS